ncbi:SDR family oxidoreductase [Verticiella sediminum]|uniref:SDR family oxidoreductase n=1 Tax=Verticiella sediminum TaxID=1247510 RepID=A0A556AMV2_9BURK|nr:SDR family oxidoreductase [Verticiella sediminum]TSH94224.1 SDR family oxidoreductase [Verticiella sediminum]
MSAAAQRPEDLAPAAAHPRSLQGKVALVTGASRGIGRAIARALARDGALVAVHCNSAREAAEALVAEIAAAGGQALVVQADLAHADGPCALLEDLDVQLRQRLGSPALDILVNNAGVIKREPIEAVTPEQFDLTLTVNLKAPFFLIQQALPRLREQGRIINISSMGTRAAFPAMAAYAPAKAGLEALTRLLAVQLGPRGITVNAVAPGLTDTAMNPLDMASPAAAQAIAGIALGRLGQPADIAEVVAFLASDAARWVTGQCIEASGGQRL